MATQCPHCHQQTEVLLAVGTSGDEASRKMMMWTVVGIVFLVVALIAAIFAVHLAKKLMQEKREKQHAELRLKTSIWTPYPFSLWASQARHESVAPQETFALRTVVPFSGARETAGNFA